MNQTITLKDAQGQLSKLVSQVVSNDKKVIITKSGKPVAALVTFADYEKIINSAKRYTKTEWERGFVLMDKARENTKKYPQEEVEEAIEQEVKEVRKAKHDL